MLTTKNNVTGSGVNSNITAANHFDNFFSFVVFFALM